MSEPQVAASNDLAMASSSLAPNESEELDDRAGERFEESPETSMAQETAAQALAADAVAMEAVAGSSEQGPLESEAELAESLSADPADYSVASDDSIEIQATETLGHYADWLALRAWDVRRLNGMAYRDPVIVGRRLTLDFSRRYSAPLWLVRQYNPELDFNRIQIGQRVVFPLLASVSPD